MTVTVQDVLFPCEECGESLMYFRGVPPSSIACGEKAVLIRRGETLSLDTYFNSFPAGKWSRYTVVGSICFRFSVEPGVRPGVRFFHATATADRKRILRLRRDENFRSDIGATSGRIRECVTLSEEEVPIREEVILSGGDEVHICRAESLPGDGILYATITAGADTLIRGMAWETDADAGSLSRVRLALGICTFRREEAVTANIRKLEDRMAHGGDSGPWGELAVYVADNGGTLREDAFGSGRVRLLRGPNLGGSAGFARTMLEALVHDRGESFTHIILMDDDIVLSADVIERTYAFLRFLKAEYRESVLGGAMLHEDSRFYQHESGALFDGTRHFRVNGRFHDMREREFVVLNTAPADVNYQGWWYCCIPEAVVSRRGLPLPLFIHFDDIEYGLRNSGHEIMLLNGICVWHPQLQNKDPVWAAYYNVRNFLIVSALYGRRSSPAVCMDLARLFLWYLLSYRYNETRLLRRAVDDFMRGAEYFIGLDAQALHREVSSFRYVRRTPNELGIETKESSVHRCSERLLLNLLGQLFRALLPKGGKIKVYEAATCNYMFDAGRCYVYDRASGDGILYEKSAGRFLSEAAAFLKSVLSLALGFSRTAGQFRDKKDVLSDVPFWEEYLRMDAPGPHPA